LVTSSCSCSLTRFSCRRIWTIASERKRIFTFRVRYRDRMPTLP
jgi:hypothetical protein